MELFDCKILYILSALAFFTMAIFFIRTRNLLQRLRDILPEDLIPHRYLSARRTLGIAYIFIGAVILIHIYLHSSEDMMRLYPGEILLVCSAQMILTTSALLSLYNSKMVRLCTVAGSIAIFMVPPLVESVSESFSISNSIVKYTLFTLFIIQIVLYSIAFITERRRYVKVMTARFGREEGAGYRKNGSSVFFILMVILVLYALVQLFIPDIGHAGAFITAYTLYNMALAVYFHLQAEESAVVHEITTEKTNLS